MQAYLVAGGNEYEVWVEEYFDLGIVGVYGIQPDGRIYMKGMISIRK